MAVYCGEGPHVLLVRHRKLTGYPSAWVFWVSLEAHGREGACQTPRVWRAMRAILETDAENNRPKRKPPPPHVPPPPSTLEQWPCPVFKRLARLQEDLIAFPWGLSKVRHEPDRHSQVEWAGLVIRRSGKSWGRGG